MLYLYSVKYIIVNITNMSTDIGKIKINLLLLTKTVKIFNS